MVIRVLGLVSDIKTLIGWYDIHQRCNSHVILGRIYFLSRCISRCGRGFGQVGLKLRYFGQLY
jgi:hypothetical protein